jgi:hypothetical protein
MSSLRCNTCALLGPSKSHPSHYSVCNWRPTEALPANIFSWEVEHLVSVQSHYENNRWIPNKQIELANKQDAGESIGDLVCVLKPCRAHEVIF